MLHFLFFCNFYQKYSKQLLIPFFRASGVTDFKVAYRIILQLNGENLTLRVSTFLKMAICSRASEYLISRPDCTI